MKVYFFTLTVYLEIRLENLYISCSEMYLYQILSIGSTVCAIQGFFPNKKFVINKSWIFLLAGLSYAYTTRQKRWNHRYFPKIILGDKEGQKFYRIRNQHIKFTIDQYFTWKKMCSEKSKVVSPMATPLYLLL